MKKLLLCILAFIMATSFAWAIVRRVQTPKVRYIEPNNDAVIDLRDKETLSFKWKSTPIPGGGRLAYKFDLYKEFGYEIVVSEKLKHNVYSVEVPVEKFKDETIYSWQVKQQDASTRTWSMDNRWSFKVRR